MGFDPVHRCRPMPALGDAVDHARNQLALTLGGWGTLGGWHNADVRVSAPALVVLLDTVTADWLVHGPSPWKVDDDGQITWTGPETVALYDDAGDHSWVLVTGHHDADAFVRLGIDRAREIAGAGWADAVRAGGVQHVYLTRSDGSLTFTADTGEPVTVYGTAPIAGVTIHRN